MKQLPLNHYLIKSDFTHLDINKKQENKKSEPFNNDNSDNKEHCIQTISPHYNIVKIGLCATR